MAGDTQPPAGNQAVPPPPLEEVAKLFPQLEIIRLVGMGGMGAVYQARQPALDRFVALKLLHTPPANDPGFAERFAQEARALAKLNHPNIVALYESGQAGGRPYFLMEFVDGLNLRQLQQAGRLSPREALQIVPQVCDALQYAHDEGIVHRDIKPENVLIDRKGRVKVADFGLAKLMGRETAATRLTGAGHTMGTPHYMAPEQVEHPLEVDHRADIFSLGVVFYELLTGELPLGKFPVPSKKVRIDVRLDEVVLRALEKEPALRYGQASELKTRVETIAKGSMSGVWSPLSGAVPSNMRGLAYVALGWLVAGLIGVPTMTALSHEPGALCFGVTTGLMALVCGIEARSERLGRRVAWATAAILVAFGLTMGVWTVVRRSQTAQNMAAMQNQVEENRRQADASAPQAARDWLSLMDGGNYAGSWDAAAASFRQAVTRADWVAESGKVRRPLGAVLSRSGGTTQQVSTFPGMPDGAYWIAEFDTAFAGLKLATEVVTFAREKDGQWRMIGYLIRPRTETERAVIVAARAWLAEIDAGDYAASWRDASRLFRDTLSQKKWEEALEEVRRPLGARLFRTADACTTTTTLPGVPAGQYVVMQFNASFAEDKSAVETVTFMQEKDGTWRAAGYFIK